VLNLGGEGEVPGAINVNPLPPGQVRRAHKLKPGATPAEIAATILEKDPTGSVVVAPATKLPFQDQSAREVRAIAFPSTVLAKEAEAIAREIVRVLTPEGTARLHSNTPVSPRTAEVFAQYGFEHVRPNELVRE
jgi:hypothetical protein